MPGEQLKNTNAKLLGDSIYFSQEWLEFREYVMKVKVVQLRCDEEDIAALDRFYEEHPYPCVEEVTPLIYNDDLIEDMYHYRPSMFQEWREELVAFREFIAETSPEELDRLQKASCNNIQLPLLIKARGGFKF